MQSFCVNAHIQTVHNILDDLSEGEGYDGEIVAVQSQYGYSYDDTCYARKRCADQKRQYQAQCRVGDAIRQRH